MHLPWLKKALFAAAAAIAAAACAAPGDDGDPGVTTGEDLVCSSSRADKLATVASKMNGRKSQHKCYHYVKQHLRDAGFDIAPIEGQVPAAQFAEWAKSNPSGLAKMGLKKITPSLGAIPKGSILVWKRGQCGYSSQYGHIEVVIDDRSSRACSDFCGNIKKTCGNPDIFAPADCGSPAQKGGPSDDLTDDPAATVDDGVGDDDDDDDTTTDVAANASDDCSGKSDGWYCSGSDESAAYRCQGSRSVDRWSCADATVCRPSGTAGKATLYGSKPGCFGSR